MVEVELDEGAIELTEIVLDEVTELTEVVLDEGVNELIEVVLDEDVIELTDVSLVDVDNAVVDISVLRVVVEEIEEKVEEMVRDGVVLAMLLEGLNVVDVGFRDGSKNHRAKKAPNAMMNSAMMTRNNGESPARYFDMGLAISHCTG